ncbi:hypothetical protein ES332_D08G248400v1 [Gossypium tomentosum]|uniref:Uncharacterized protein n=1 Tax=Gossypium tomentosum TaxID=34277 RepID=A0A5D2JZD5_GOSTO|nr:hypothetical protein ES332_D08G248400v1 [Gossypium tomentosum]
MKVGIHQPLPPPFLSFFILPSSFSISLSLSPILSPFLFSLLFVPSPPTISLSWLLLELAPSFASLPSFFSMMRSFFLEK